MLLSYVNRSDLANAQAANGDATDGKSHNSTRGSFGGMSEALLLAALVALTNVAVLTDWHDEFYIALHSLYRLVDNGNPAIKLQSLRLLINLSCNEDMVPSLLAAQVSLSSCCSTEVHNRVYTPMISDWNSKLFSMQDNVP